MKKTILIFICLAMIPMFTGCKKDQTIQFAVETIAMGIGYELSGDFEWTADVDRYYVAIMEGKLTIDAAQVAEQYLREVTHPLIANRIVGLAGRVGFNLDESGGVAGVDQVDMELLQSAALGFKTGLSLK